MNFFEVKFEIENDDFTVNFRIEDENFNLKFGEINVIEKSYVEEYKGIYEVTPIARESVVLETKGKRMAENVTVKEIPYFETSNMTGGNTVFIGKEI